MADTIINIENILNMTTQYFLNRVRYNRNPPLYVFSCFHKDYLANHKKINDNNLDEIALNSKCLFGLPRDAKNQYLDYMKNKIKGSHTKA